MTTPAVLHRPWSRLATAALTAVSCGGALAIALLVLGLDERLGLGLRLGNPLRLLRAFAYACLFPGAAAWLLRRAFAGRVVVTPGMLVLEDRRRRTEIPLEAIDGVRAWRVPLPAGGLWLRLRSGRWFDRGIEVADPVALVGALAAAGGPAHVGEAARAPAACYAATHPWATRRWHQPLVAFVGFALVPALPLFRLHQWIAYGGTFGEYYVYGLRAYLLAFGIYWATAVVYLVLYAAVLRTIAEPIVAVAAWRTPTQLPHVRRVVETVLRVVYVGGVPLFLLRLFLMPS